VPWLCCGKITETKNSLIDGSFKKKDFLGFTNNEKFKLKFKSLNAYKAY
jgi:hypothetical protein